MHESSANRQASPDSFAQNDREQQPAKAASFVRSHAAAVVERDQLPNHRRPAGRPSGQHPVRAKDRPTKAVLHSLAERPVRRAGGGHEQSARREQREQSQ